jgi:hypothetical protein
MWQALVSLAKDPPNVAITNSAADAEVVAKPTTPIINATDASTRALVFIFILKIQIKLLIWTNCLDIPPNLSLPN